MKFAVGGNPKTKRELCDRISVAMMEVPRGTYARSPLNGEPYRDFEGTFYLIECGVNNLRNKFGNNKADQLLEMLTQAKAHYSAGINKLGGALMEDTKMLVMDRQPWAYPKELYRWNINPSLPELSANDIESKDG